MIGPLRSYQDVYVATCGAQFTSTTIGIQHERSCDSCRAEAYAVCPLCNSDSTAVANAEYGCCETCHEEQLATEQEDCKPDLVSP